MIVSYLAEILLLGAGGYALLIGLSGSSLELKLYPARWRGSDEVAVVGRMLVFLAMLVLPTCFGFSFSEIREWLESIWTTGGGAGTG